MVGGGFAGNHHGSWDAVLGIPAPNPIVERDDVQYIQELPLVLMDALYLAVKERIDINGDL